MSFCGKIDFVCLQVHKATRDRGTTGSVSARHGKVLGSRLGRGTMAFVGYPMLVPGLVDPQNRVIAKDVKSCTYCCYVRYAILIVRVGGNALAPKNRCNSLPCTVRTSRQRSCNQRVGCLLGIWLGSGHGSVSERARLAWSQP